MRALLLLFIFIISGCVSTPEEESRFRTTVQISEFNSLSSKYVYKPTFGTIYKRDGELEYFIQANRFGSGILWIHVKKSEVQKYLGYINTYLKWNKIAKRDGDLLDKDIDKLGLESGQDLVVSFHSGNKEQHYLTFEGCSPIVDYCIYLAGLDESNVKKLQQELERFNSGELSINNIGNKYN